MVAGRPKGQRRCCALDGDVAIICGVLRPRQSQMAYIRHRAGAQTEIPRCARGLARSLVAPTNGGANGFLVKRALCHAQPRQRMWWTEAGGKFAARIQWQKY